MRDRRSRMSLRSIRATSRCATCYPGGGNAKHGDTHATHTDHRARRHERRAGARLRRRASGRSGIVGGPFTAYIRLPKLFEAAQGLRESLASGPLSAREQQIVNLTVARHWGARYPWFAQARRSLTVGIPQAVIDAINARQTPDLPDARERTCHAVARELLGNKTLSDAELCGRREDDGASRAWWRWWRRRAASR